MLSKYRAEGCPLGFVGVASVGCSFFTDLWGRSLFSIEAHDFGKFPHGLCEPLPFAIRTGCQNVNCPGYLIGILKSPLKKTNTKIYTHQKKFTATLFLKARASHPRQRFPVLPGARGCVGTASTASLRAQKTFIVA